VAVALVVAVTSGCAAEPMPRTAEPMPGSGAGLVPKGDTVRGARVDRVVDGDTVHVLVAGDDVTIRLIGIDTPETVKPGSPVECYGPEASDFAKDSLDGRSVTLEFDASQGLTDRYGRTLAYVWIEEPDGGLTLFNLESVSGGYADARQYGSTPYAWKSEFERAERAARSSGAGLWGSCQQ
jgi:micrococcal nuclease